MKTPILNIIGSVLLAFLCLVASVFSTALVLRFAAYLGFGFFIWCTHRAYRQVAAVMKERRVLIGRSDLADLSSAQRTGAIGQVVDWTWDWWKKETQTDRRVTEAAAAASIFEMRYLVCPPTLTEAPRLLVLRESKRQPESLLALCMYIAHVEMEVPLDPLDEFYCVTKYSALVELISHGYMGEPEIKK